MSERRSAADLGSPAEASLLGFPFPERNWEKDARAVEARLAETPRSSTDAALLAAPFPSEPGEPTALSATTTPLAHSGVRTQSLADMARRSVEQKHAAERQMARESLALAAQSRPSSEQAAALREAVGTVRAAAPPAPVSVAHVVSTQRASLPAPAAPPSNRAWPTLGLVVGAFALAAAVLLWLRQPPAPAPLVSSVTPEAAQAKSDQPAAVSPTQAGEAARAAALPAAAVAIDPSTLSREATAQAADPKHAKVSATAASAPAPALSASGAGPAPEKFVLEDDQPSAAQAPADKPDKGLPPDPALRPADSTGGAIPVKPSTGAVQAALGAVMSGARHCVAGDEGASSAVVVFGSDGRVTRVTVSGPAAGKPAGACIEGQLSHARVQPFAATSFSINTTVRPD